MQPEHRHLSDQVAKHARLKIAIHHGLGRAKDSQSLAGFDVIITSFGTLASDHKKSSTEGLFGWDPLVYACSAGFACPLASWLTCLCMQCFDSLLGC